MPDQKWPQWPNLLDYPLVRDVASCWPEESGEQIAMPPAVNIERIGGNWNNEETGVWRQGRELLNRQGSARIYRAGATGMEFGYNLFLWYSYDQTPRGDWSWVYTASIGRFTVYPILLGDVRVKGPPEYPQGKDWWRRPWNVTLWHQLNFQLWENYTIFPVSYQDMWPDRVPYPQ